MKKPKLLPPLYALLILIVMYGFDEFFPLLHLQIPSIVGWFFIALALFVFLWSNYLFRKNKTSIMPHDKPSSLLLTGPYRFSRNPIYLAMLSLLLGLGVFFNSLSSIILPFIFPVIMSHTFIPFEEKNLEKAFGKKYTEYQKKVRRWI